MDERDYKRVPLHPYGAYYAMASPEYMGEIARRQEAACRYVPGYGNLLSASCQGTTELWHGGALMYRSHGARTHSPKPRMRKIGDVWMCYSKTHAAVEPTQGAAYQRWEGMK